MSKQIRAYKELELKDGSKVKLTLSWELLIKLRSKSKSDYTRYSKMVTHGIGDDVIGMITVLYAAYLCAYVEEKGSFTGAMSESEFTAQVPDSYRLVSETVNWLLDPK